MATPEMTRFLFATEQHTQQREDLVALASLREQGFRSPLEVQESLEQMETSIAQDHQGSQGLDFLEFLEHLGLALQAF
jgi:hypothetical protein